MPRRVEGVGPKDASIMIIGEALGANEERLRQPFVGNAGKLLDECLHGAGILRRSCYITNVVKERPPRNDVKNFIKINQKSPNKTITTEAYDQYEEELYKEVERINPDVIITLGNIPLYALCREIGVTKYRGSVLKSITGHNVVPVLHPAAALRMYIWKYLIIFDLMRCKEIVNGTYKASNFNLITDPDYTTVCDFIRKIRQSKRLYFDIEISNLELSDISLAFDDSLDVISINFLKDGVDKYTPVQEAEIMRMLSEVLEDSSIEKVAQNAMFDTSFLRRKYGMVIRNLQDTMIASALLFPEFPKGLDFLASIYSTVPYYKDDGKHKNRKTNEKKAQLYSAKDSAVLTEIFPKQLKDLEKFGNLKAYNRTTRLLQPLLDMTDRGIKMNVEAMNAESENVSKEIEEITERIKTKTGKDINPSSPSQLKEYFYGDLKIKPYLSGGSPTTDESALKRIARRGYDVASDILEYRRLSKLNSTYLTMDLDNDGRLRCSMNPVGAISGRLSSSKTIQGTGANMQNQPPVMKRFMMPDEGYVAYEIDLEQAENRVVAYIAPDLTMIDAFETGQDIHAKTASGIFDIPINEVSNEPGTAPIGSGEYSQRFWGKKANHSLNYGMGSEKFSLTLEISKEDAKFLWSGYHATYPGVRQMWEWIKEDLSKGRTLTNLYGRKIRLLDRWGFQLFNQAYSFIPQSSVAETINQRGLNEIYYDPYKYAGVELLNQVHDSIWIQVPLSLDWQRHAQILQDIKASLEQPLTTRHGHTFTLPAGITMLPFNLKDGYEVETITAQNLKELYGRAKAEVK